MQLPPDCLKVVPAEDAKAFEDELRGQWLPLFRGSAPYIAMFRQSTMVLHLPGYLLEPSAREELEGLLGDITLCALLGVRPVLVPSLEARLHRRCEAERIPTGDALAALDGEERRIAEQRTIRLAKEEAGAVGAELESLLDRLRATRRRVRSAAASPPPKLGAAESDFAAGSGGGDGETFSVYASAQLFTTVALSGPTDRLRGRVHRVDVARIQRRQHSADMVCILPLGASESGGEVRCVDSEALAAEVAKQLGAAKLVFFTRGQRLVDVRRSHVVSQMQVKDASAFVRFAKETQLFREDEPAKEIIRYLELLVQALASGTRRGHLVNAAKGALLQELYTTDGQGTLVSQDLYDGIRLAMPLDVSGILGLTEPLVSKGLLRRRSGYEVENACRNREMFVWKRDDRTIGCASLQCFDDAPDMAELGCFVVSEECRGKGHGTVLLSYMERVAKLQGLRTIFLLTTQTMQWFVERGFQEASVAELPQCKQRSYDLGRSSKVYVKHLDSMPTEVMERFSFVEIDTLE